VTVKGSERKMDNTRGFKEQRLTMIVITDAEPPRVHSLHISEDNFDMVMMMHY
jgi:hypothetical protein